MSSKMTEEQLKSNDRISDETIEKDISDTQKEIDFYEVELEHLRKNPVENKVKIYLKEGQVESREFFIDQLKQIQEYRRERNESNSSSGD